MNCRIKCASKALLVVVAIGVLGWVVMVLWNWVIPTLFAGAHAIDFTHALGLLVLSRILFGGFRGHGGWHGQDAAQQERDNRELRRRPQQGPEREPSEADARAPGDGHGRGRQHRQAAGEPGVVRQLRHVSIVARAEGARPATGRLVAWRPIDVL